MILPAGSFRVQDYRKAIPDWVKVQVILNLVEAHLGLPSLDARELQFDHRPPLIARDYDTNAGDFIPPQNDPDYIFALRKAQHLEETTGRKEGADKTVTTRGSDVGEAARTREMADTAKVHEAALLSKAGDFRGAALVLASRDPRKVRQKNRHKQKIQSRGFDKGHRPMRSR